MNVTSYNKEVLENKFLIERLIYKLQEAGKISDEENSGVLLLFRKTLLRHEGEDPKKRLQLLVEAFSAWENQKIEVQQQKSTQKVKPSTQEVSQIGLPEELFAPEEKQDQTEEKSLSAPNDIVADRIKMILEKHEDIPPHLKEKVEKYLLSEIEAVAGTGVNEKVMDRFIEVSLNSFKRKEGLVQEKEEHSEVVSNVVPEVVSEVVEEQRSVEVLSEDKKDITTPSKPIEVLQLTPSELQSPTVSEPVLVQLVQEEVVQPVEPAQEEVAPEPVAVVQQASPAAVVSTGSAVSKDNDFKVHVTSDSSHSAGISTEGSEKKSLAQTILEQAREADKVNPLVSHQREIKIPARRLSAKKLERSEVIPVIPEKPLKPLSIPRPIIPQVEGTGEVKLSSASNTKVVFDKKTNLESDRVLERHDLRQQQNDLFGKYIAEQLDTVTEVVSGKGVVGEEALQKLRDEIIRDAQKITKNEHVSISEKLHELDEMFTQKRHRYAVANQAQPNVSIEELVDGIMARAGQEIHTNDSEADARFRETLRNTLHFKAKHLFGVQMEKNKVQSALDEEYVKHKGFYLKSIK